MKTRTNLSPKNHDMKQVTSVTDAHSSLNSCRPLKVERPTSIGEVRQLISKTRIEGGKLIAAGGRHSMGGQQLIDNGILMDTRGMSKVLHLDRARKLVKVEAGITWTQLIQELRQLQHDGPSGSEKTSGQTLGIVQKPTGVDDITIGGCISSNIHGRGLTLAPFANDIEEIEIIDSNATPRKLSRTIEPELFSLVIGGYGLFGLVTTVTLRLRNNVLMRRSVEEIGADELIGRFEQRIAAGHEYGDFQFNIDNQSPDFLQHGILSTYASTDEGTASAPHKLSLESWERLCELAHTSKSEAYRRYRDHYLATDGQTYWSDTMQLSTYLDGYHDKLDRKLGVSKSSEMITEVYVPRPLLATFLQDAAKLLKFRQADIVYGTIRLIEKDSLTFLPWARESYACIVFNFHTNHSIVGVEKTRETIRALLDLAIQAGGSFYLTYHRWARAEQIEQCYPQIRQFLKSKNDLDPNELFYSQWYEFQKSLWL